MNPNQLGYINYLTSKVRMPTSPSTLMIYLFCPYFLTQKKCPLYIYHKHIPPKKSHPLILSPSKGSRCNSPHNLNYDYLLYNPTLIHKRKIPLISLDWITPRLKLNPILITSWHINRQFSHSHGWHYWVWYTINMCFYWNFKLMSQWLFSFFSFFKNYFWAMWSVVIGSKMACWLVNSMSIYERLPWNQGLQHPLGNGGWLEGSQSGEVRYQQRLQLYLGRGRWTICHDPIQIPLLI